MGLETTISAALPVNTSVFDPPTPLSRTQTTKSMSPSLNRVPSAQSIAVAAPPEADMEKAFVEYPDGSRRPRGTKRRPIGLKWRSSSWFMTTVVALGVASDALAYNIIVPVLPYRLQALGYTGVSALTSWLFVAYSVGIFILSFPIAYFFSRHTGRRLPLVIAVLFLVASTLVLMLVNPYPAMVVARFVQGSASTIVWTVGFALICENVPEKNIGRQIGWALSGLTVGTTIAPPIGGALYWKFGWKAPLIFALVLVVIDLIGRLLVVEQRYIYEYDCDPIGEGILMINEISKQRSLEKKDGIAAIAADIPPRTAQLPPTEASTDGQALDRPAVVELDSVSELKPWEVIRALTSSKRGMNGLLLTMVYGIVLGLEDPTLTLHVQDVWHKDSDFVGIIYLIASAPTFVAGPVIGHLSDKFGSEWIMFPFLVFTLPWFPLMILRKSIVGFIFFFLFSTLGAACALGPTGLEITLAARNKKGLTEIHQFAAMNVAFAVSTCVGAIAGGQMYDHLTKGWDAVCWFNFATVLVFLPSPFFLGGARPLYRRLMGKAADPKEQDPEEQKQDQTSQLPAPDEEQVDPASGSKTEVSGERDRALV